MNKEEIKVMIKDCVYSEDGITYMSDKQYNNYINIIEQLQQENKQLKDNWNKLKEYCQDNSFMENTREYGTLTVVDADELAIYMEKLEKSDSNE